MSDDILHYYQRELAYLRHEGADFAARYPKVAARLGLHGAESLDPHTERLIEATAFLAARVHRDLDQTFPQVASALLENLCPSLVQPVPSMTVAQFELDPSQGKVTAGFPVPRHTGLHARAETGDTCRFRTAWDTTLWPLSITDASFGDDATLHLRLACETAAHCNELELDRLRIHLHGDWMETMPLYELLTLGVTGVALRVPDVPGAPAVPLRGAAWREVGYAPEDAVLPLPPHAQPAYGLMQEYFAFPRKFHFFDLLLPEGLPVAGPACEIVLRLERAPRGSASIGAHLFRLGCTPVINLFSQTSEPIAIDHRQYEYRLVADRQREAVTEIHSITSVVASDPSQARTQTLVPYAAADHAGTQGGAPCWVARRERSQRGGMAGTDTYLGFVEASEHWGAAQGPIVYANVLCTNRRLAEQVSVGARMTLERAAPNVRVRCLYEPGAQRTPPLGSETLWRLVSLLTLNHQSLVSGATGHRQMQEMLRLFASDRAREQDQIRGLKSLRACSVNAHVGSEAWRGYCRGTEVAVEFDADAFVGGSPLLMGAVLARFLALYTSVNSFVRLVVRRGDETWKQWEPMTGCQPLV